jgi:DNA-binding helix-hairpin-helix protein with protein kinase domain
LQLGQRLGVGGQGEVRALANRRDLVYKQYLQPLRDPEPLTSLIAARDLLAGADRQMLDACTSWPQAIVVNEGQTIGLLMVRLPDRFYGQLAQGPRPRELQYALYPPKPGWAGMGTPSDEDRWGLAAHIARLFSFLHRIGVVLGDVSMTNAVWSVNPIPELFLLDCDSVRLSGQMSSMTHATTIDWDDPLNSREPTLDTDRYKLALFIGRLLSATPYWRPGQSLPPVGRVGQPHEMQQLELLFERAAGKAGTRPTAHEWAAALP